MRSATGTTGEFARGWRILLTALLGTMFGASPLPFNTIGSFIKPLMAEFHAGPAEIGLVITIYGITGCLVAPLIGAAADRYGTRPVALLSVAGFGLCFAFVGAAQSLAMLWAIYFVIGLVGMGSTPVTWSRAISGWFWKNRGLALGLMLVGTGIAGFLLPSVSVWLIDHVGWRWAYVALGCLPLVIALPVAFLFLRDPPESEAVEGSAALAGKTLAQALRDRRFWTMFWAFFIVSLAYGGFHINLQTMLRMSGYSDSAGALIAGLIGLSIIAGRIGTGLLVDRIWAPLVGFPLLALPAIACLLFATGTLSLPIAIVTAILLGLAAGAESDLIAFMAARYFGMAYFGRIYGLIYSSFGIGTALSPLLYGYSVARWGSYAPALHLAAILFICGATMLLTLGRYPDSTPEPEAGAGEGNGVLAA